MLLGLMFVGAMGGSAGGRRSPVGHVKHRTGLGAVGPNGHYGDLGGAAQLADRGSGSLNCARLVSPLVYLCPRSGGRKRANRVRTVQVAALSESERRFGVPGAVLPSGRDLDDLPGAGPQVSP